MPATTRPKDAVVRNKPPRSIRSILERMRKRAPVTAPFSFGAGWGGLAAWVKELDLGHVRNDCFCGQSGTAAARPRKRDSRHLNASVLASEADPLPVAQYPNYARQNRTAGFAIQMPSTIHRSTCSNLKACKSMGSPGNPINRALSKCWPKRGSDQIFPLGRKIQEPARPSGARHLPNRSNGRRGLPACPC